MAALQRKATNNSKTVKNTDADGSGASLKEKYNSILIYKI